MTDQKPKTSSEIRNEPEASSSNAPFHCFQPELPPKSGIQGSVDLLEAYGLGTYYQRFCQTRRLPEDLASFLPQLYGNFNFQASQEASSLRSLVEKPPIHKEITKLSNSAMQGFRLSTGPVDMRYQGLFTYFDKRKILPESQLVYDEKQDIIRVKHTLEPFKPPKDEYDDDGGRKKHKKSKKAKKEKKKKREYEERARNGSVSESDKEVKRDVDSMEF